MIIELSSLLLFFPDCKIHEEHRKEKAPEAAGPSSTDQLLMEIRDELKKR
jgi:nitrate reductase assembly molybdenum cofactor insertion protein NarJ